MQKSLWHLKFKIFYYLLKTQEQKEVDDFIKMFDSATTPEKTKILSLIRISPNQLTKNLNLDNDILVMAYETLEAIYYLNSDINTSSSEIYLNNSEYLESILFRELLPEKTLDKLKSNEKEKDYFFGILSNNNIHILKENLLSMNFTEYEISYLSKFSEIFKFFKEKY